MFRVSAFVREEDGKVLPFLVEVSAPQDSGKGDSFCTVSCPFLRAKPFSIFGVDHAQAVERSRRFVELNLEHMNVDLIDANGDSIELPPMSV
jgi:hypothetical protein